MKNQFAALIVLAIAWASMVDASAAPAKGQRTVVRTQSMVLTPMALPTGVIPGTLGGTLFGYPQQTSVSGSLERQLENGQLAKLRYYQGKLFYENSELNGSLPLLDQISWLRWKEMDFKPQVAGPMSVLSTRQGTAVQTLVRQTKFPAGVPMKSAGANITEY